MFNEQDNTLLWTCVTGAHLQCVNNHYAKFEYKGIKLLISYRLHKPDTPYAFSDGKYV